MYSETQFDPDGKGNYSENSGEIQEHPEGRMSGYVKYFNEQRGFGFLETSEGDVFLHIRNVVDNSIPVKDTLYWFELGEGRKNGRASAVNASLTCEVVLNNEHPENSGNTRNQPESRMSGFVKFYNEENGYGFLGTPNGDLFLHISEVVDKTIPAKSAVYSYEIGTSAKDGRTIATNVSLLHPSTLSNEQHTDKRSVGERRERGEHGERRDTENVEDHDAGLARFLKL